MQRVLPALVILAALLTPSIAPAQTGNVATLFRFVETDATDAAALLVELTSCTAETHAFASIVAGIGEPIATRAAEHVPGTLFAASYDAESMTPRLVVSLAAIGKLPTASAAREWGRDSSWAFTRCEVLAHELAESLAYRALWTQRPPNEDGPSTRLRFGARYRAAHRAGLDAESAVGTAQAIRVTAAGQPYARSRECFERGAIHIVFGSNTQTLLVHQDTLAMAYHPGADLCPVPRVRPSRAVPRQGRMSAIVPGLPAWTHLVAESFQHE